MAKSGWAGQKTVTTATPALYTNLYYDVSRSGNTVTYSLALKVWTNSSTGWRNNRWACEFTVNGSSLGKNRTIKPQTSGAIGTTPYWPTSDSSGSGSYACSNTTHYLYSGKTTTVGSSATSMNVTVRIKDTGYGTGETGTYSWGTPSADFGNFSWDLPIDLPVYTVSYNANGGTSTPSSQSVNGGNSITLASAIKKNNTDSTGTITISYDANGGSGAPGNSTGTYTNTTPYTFSKWAAGSTSGTKYDAGASYTVNGNVTMYATWNTGTTTRKTNPSITLSSTKPTRTYYTFSHWYNGSNTYNPGSAYTFSENKTLYASWTPNKPTSLNISRTGSTTTSISVQVSATGLTMTNYTLYYRAGTSGSYTSKSLGTATTGTISGLSVDTNYQIYFTATNAGGTSTSSTVTYSTTLGNPSITTPIKRNLFPYMCDISATGSITPSRTLTYAFSKDGGTNWTAYQSSNTYHWADLTAETTYNMGVKVKATHVGTNASDTTATSYLSITTPTDQARTRIKVNGQWKKGRTFIKHENKWKKAKAVYIKVDGHWVENKNFYDGEPSIWD